jgi:hypothetical protein
MADWNPDVYECPNCKDLVYSKSPGDFATCKCWANVTDNLGLAVDQTEYYTRLIGNMRAVHKGKLHNDN